MINKIGWSSRFTFLSQNIHTWKTRGFSFTPLHDPDKPIDLMCHFFWTPDVVPSVISNVDVHCGCCCGCFRCCCCCCYYYCYFYGPADEFCAHAPGVLEWKLSIREPPGKLLFSTQINSGSRLLCTGITMWQMLFIKSSHLHCVLNQTAFGGYVQTKEFLVQLCGCFNQNMTGVWYDNCSEALTITNNCLGYHRIRSDTCEESSVYWNL